jgi:hypothetical protein
MGFSKGLVRKGGDVLGWIFVQYCNAVKSEAAATP